jgi:spermidine/putrescine transport system permease protein
LSKSDVILKIYTILLLGIIYVPIGVLIVFSFNNSRNRAVFTGFTLENYYRLLADERVWSSFYNSIWVAIVVTIASVFFAILLSYAVTRYDFKGKDILDMLLLIPIIIPEIVEALTLLLFFIIIGIPLSPWTIIIGHIAFDISFAYLVIKARMAGYDPQYEEAARTLGADELKTFFRVTLPILLPGIIAASLIAFVESYDDFIKSYFTRPGGFSTLPVHIWSMASRRGVTVDLNALATIVVIIAIFFAYIRIKMERWM